MQLQTHLVRRKSHFYFRTRIPTDLKSHYGKTEILISLKTSDKRIADYELAKLKVKLYAEFARLRGDNFGIELKPSNSNNQSKDTTVPDVNNSTDTVQNVYNVVNTVSNVHNDINTVNNVNSTNTVQNVANSENTVENVSNCINPVNNVANSTDTVQNVYNNTNTVQNVANSSIVPNTEPTIEHLVEYWASQSEKRERTILEVHTARKRLFKITGAKYANQVVKKDVIKFKDEMIAGGLSAKTVQKQINLLKTVFTLAMCNDMIQKNPFTDIKIVKPKCLPKPRVPFSAEDLKAIFSSPIFTKGERPVGGAGEACIWLPYIALWTGMRLEEIGQLQVSDIKCENGIYFINIGNDEFSTKRLKTTSSHRRIPIHQELIRLGLLDYVQKMKEKQSSPLFPMLVENSYHQYTAAFSKWFGRYLRGTIGITDKRKTFHSFRHGFKEACRIAEINKDLHDKLTGHQSSADVGDGYGGDLYPLMPLYNAIQRIEFRFE